MDPRISQRTEHQFLTVLQLLVQQGREIGRSEIPIRDERGAVIATLVLHTSRPVRPKDMPRALRPKQKLSKRQRVAAKRAKAREAVAA